MPTLDTQHSPYSIEAEQATLGCLLLEPRRLRAVRDILPPSAFWMTLHRTLYETLLNMDARKQAIDPLTVAEELRKLPAPFEYADPRDTSLKAIGGRDYLLKLLETFPTAANVIDYARVVQEKSVLRQIMTQAKEAFDLSASGDMQTLSAGNGHYNLSALIKTAAPGLPDPVRLDTVQSERTQWLWKGWLPRGKFVTVSGDPGLFKSGICADWAATVTQGGYFPLTTTRVEAGNVLFLVAEDGVADTLKPRLEAAGADLSRVYAYTPEQLPEFDIEGLRAKMSVLRPRLIVVDPFTAFIPEAAESKNSTLLRKNFLNPLTQLAQEFDCTIIGLFHLNKTSTVTNAVYRSSGRLDFVAAARAAMIVAKDPQNENCFVLASSKMNLCKSPQSLRYHVESVEEDTPPRVVWDGIAEGQSADDLLSSASPDARDKDMDASSVDYAQGFLVLELGEGPVKTDELKRQAKAAGLSWRTVERAKNGLVRSKRMGGKGSEGYWAWELLDESARDVKIVARTRHLTMVEYGANDAAPVSAAPADTVKTANPAENTATSSTVIGVGGLNEVGGLNDLSTGLEAENAPNSPKHVEERLKTAKTVKTANSYNSKSDGGLNGPDVGGLNAPMEIEDVDTGFAALNRFLSDSAPFADTGLPPDDDIPDPGPDEVDPFADEPFLDERVGEHLPPDVREE